MSSVSASVPWHGVAGADEVGIDPLSGPGSTTVTSTLMEDTATAASVSILLGSGQDSLVGKVAPFANPLLDYKEEALVINKLGELTHLRRGDQGWRQRALLDAQGNVIKTAEVVVVVHPFDLRLIAVYPDADGVPQLLELVKSDETGGSWRWRGGPSGSPIRIKMMYVFYSGRVPAVTGIDPKTGSIVSLLGRLDGDNRFESHAWKTPFSTKGVTQLVAGRDPGFVDPVCYLVMDGKLSRFSVRTQTLSTLDQRANNRWCLLGVFDANGAGIGLIYQDLTSGSLAVRNYGSNGPVASSILGNDFIFGSAWVDVNNMVHVYGVRSTEWEPVPVLQVLHQVAWEAGGMLPAWSKAKDEKRNRMEEVLTPLVEKVGGFVVDPFPDYEPSLFVSFAGERLPEERFAIYTQDIACGVWSRDRIGLAATGSDPHVVTNYVSSVTFLDGRGTPMPGLTVKVSAESIADVRIDGAACLIGPGLTAEVRADATGKVTVAVPADGLMAPALHFDAVGLKQGAVVQPAAAVHDFLAGSGTLASQPGLFNEEALKKAKVGTRLIVDPKHQGAAGAAVLYTQKAFRAASGAPFVPHLSDGTGPAQTGHGFSFGSGAPHSTHGMRLPYGVEGVPDEDLPIYREFTTAEEFDAHWEEIRSRPDYGGIIDDFVTWGTDVWEGIKNGVITVVEVSVEAVGRLVVKMGYLVFELTEFVIDTVTAAIRVVEAAFAQVVTKMTDVVDWLKALFSFRDVWETKEAMDSGLRMVLGYGDTVLQNIQKQVPGWFAKQEQTVKDCFTALRASYVDRPLGDEANRPPALVSSSGQALSQRTLRDDPQVSWLSTQVLSTPMITAFRAADARAVGAAPISAAIGNAFTDFLDALAASGVSDHVQDALGDLAALLVTVTDPRDPASARKSSIAALIDVAEKVVLVLLEALDAAFVAALGAVHTTITHIGDLLDSKLPKELSPLNDLYRWIQTQAGVTPKDATWGGLVLLLIAFPATVVYKLVVGVDQRPFPGGFPHLPAPPAHPDHDPNWAPESEKDYNALLKQLQFDCAMMSLPGVTWDVLGELSALQPTDAGYGKTLETLIAMGSASSTALWLGMVMAVPPVTGADWDGSVNNRTWSLAFGAAAANVALQYGLIAWADLSDSEDGPILKNKRSPKATKKSPITFGPIMATTLGWFYMFFAASALKGTNPNPFATAQLVTGALPGMVQILRYGLKFDPKGVAFLVRGGVVAGIVGLSDLTSITLLATMSSARNPAPTVVTTNLPDAVVGRAYEAALTATGGDQPWNAPIKGWTVTGGTLPTGLVLDGETGKVTGVPMNSLYTRFSVACTDSYGPPQFSDPHNVNIWVRPAE